MPEQPSPYQPESDIVVPEAIVIPSKEPIEKSTVEQQQEQERLRLVDYFADLKDGDFRLFEMHKAIEENVARMCRHALAANADVMLFTDQSARGHGLIAKHMLPVIRYELAIVQHVSPLSIRLPEIKFFYPVRFKLDERMQPTGMDEYFDEFKRTLGPHLFHKKVLICDEVASKNDDIKDAISEARKLSPKQQYDYFQPEHWNSIVEQYGGNTTSRKWARWIHGYMPEVDIVSHSGPPSADGVDPYGGSSALYYLYGTMADSKENRSTVKRVDDNMTTPQIRERREKLFQRHGIKDENEFAQRVRIEHKMMAREIFMKIETLTKNPMNIWIYGTLGGIVYQGYQESDYLHPSCNNSQSVEASGLVIADNWHNTKERLDLIEAFLKQRRPVVAEEHDHFLSLSPESSAEEYAQYQRIKNMPGYIGTSDILTPEVVRELYSQELSQLANK